MIGRHQQPLVVGGWPLSLGVGPAFEQVMNRQSGLCVPHKIEWIFFLYSIASHSQLPTDDSLDINRTRTFINEIEIGLQSRHNIYHIKILSSILDSYMELQDIHNVRIWEFICILLR